MFSWTEDQKGKFIGAVVLFLMHITPIILIRGLEQGEFMGGQKPIKAVLKHDINYKDLSGSTKTIAGGEVVHLYLVKEGTKSIDMSGKTSIQRSPAFVGLKGFDYFDVQADEVKTID